MNKPILFINGCFDLLHVGHFNFLNYCSNVKNEYGLEFHVGLDSDTKICLDKGPDRPIFSYTEREIALKNFMVTDEFMTMSLIDHIHKFQDNKELERIIEHLKPKIMIKGEEWRHKVVGQEFCKKVFFYPTHLYPFSSSKIIKQITEMYLNEDFGMR